MVAEGDAAWWKEMVDRLAAKQLKTYADEPLELISHATHETAVLEGYRGRQVLELIQNADDANGETRTGRLRIHVTRSGLVAANTGEPFTERGLKSLVISDASPKLLTRNRFIGCKGLGFRSVLTWTDAPTVVSGGLRVGFDRDRAVESLRSLAANHPELEAEIAKHVDRFGRAPVSIMRFPAWATGDRIAPALAWVEQGFSTVVALPFAPGPAGDAAHDEAVRQLESMVPATVLFCRNLDSIQFSGDLDRTWELRRTRVDATRVRILINAGSEEWIVHWRAGRIPNSLDTRRGASREYELAVAVPLHAAGAGENDLCVYFPTNETLPIPVRLHATLDLTEDRKRVIEHGANGHVLRRLGVMLADVIAREAAARGGSRALGLVDGLQGCDPELDRLGFKRAALRSLSARRIFPTIAGGLATAAGTRRAANDAWARALSPKEFPEVLDAAAATRPRILEAFGLDWYETGELVRRLRHQLARSERGEAGRVVGILLKAGCLRGINAAELVIDSEGNFVGAGGRCFFRPANASNLPEPPGWATVRLVDAAFQAELVSAAATPSLRGLSEKIAEQGGVIHEFGLEAVARALIDDAKAGSGAARVSRTRELLRWLHSATAGEHDVLRRLRVELITSGGSLRLGRELYFSSEYPRGALVSRLYASWGAALFVAPPGELGLEGIEVSSVEAFLDACGVTSTPRMVDPSYDLRRRFTEHTLDTQTYPLVVRGRPYETPSAVRAAFSCQVLGVQIPERLEELLTGGDASAIAAYFLSEGAALITSDDAPQASFHTLASRERNGSSEANVRVSNPVLWLLQENAWVPCADGNRHRPREIILSRSGARLLAGAFWNAAIDARDPLIQSRGGGSAGSSLLMRLGAIANLEEMTDESLYALLGRLPVTDPGGKVAPAIYRTLLDRRVLPSDSPSCHAFRSTGRVWSCTGKAAGYLPVGTVRYNGNISIPEVIERELALIDLPRRENRKLVEALFGVVPLLEDEIGIEVRDEGTDFDPTSEDANAVLARALPYLYALRLHKNADVDERERRTLEGLQLCLCQTLRAEVRLPSGEKRDIALTRPGARIAVGTELYVIGEYEPDSPRARRLWQAVANLVAETLGVDVGAEFALVLQSRDADEMRETVRELLGEEEGEEALRAAFTRMEEPVEPLPPESYVVPPQPAPAPREPEDPDAAQGPEEPAGPVDGSRPRGEYTVTGAEPPERRPGTKRRLVIAGATEGAPRRPSGPIAREDVTFRIVEAFEQLSNPPRFAINVSHVRGLEGLGCDLVSVASDEIRTRVEQDGRIDDRDIERYIEVKGRSSRQTAVELEESQLRQASAARERYFVYRVFVDRKREGRFEVAVLRDPLNSRAVRMVPRFELGAGSGAEWFALTEVEKGGSDRPAERDGNAAENDVEDRAAATVSGS